MSNLFCKKLYSGLRLALPPRCVLCDAPAAGTLVCAPCSREMPAIGEACPRCALPSAADAVCGDCFVDPPPERSVVCAFRYAFPVDRMVHALKYRGELALADWFAQMLADAVRSRAAVAARATDRADERGAHDGEPASRAATPPADVVVAMPLAPTRQRERGFNQAGEIARRLAGHLDLDMSRALTRVRETPPQATLPWKARARNMRGAFACSPHLAGARVALVDDVMTSGASVHAATHALLAAGARSVDAWIVARTLRDARL